MSVFNAIKNLRSYKEPKEELIPRKTLGRILEAGRDTPSPGNVQSLEFIVVEDDQKKRMLTNDTDDERIEESPVAVIVISDMDRMERRVGREDVVPFSSAEAACSIENMRLVAREEGISSCWITGFDKDMVSDQFRIPDGKVPMGVVIFAYAEQEYEKEDRFGLNSVLFYDEYDNQVGSLFDDLEWEGLRENREIVERRKERLTEKIRQKLKVLL